MQFRNFLLSALRPDDAAALTPHLRETSLSRGQVLFEPGNPVDSIYFPSSACLSVIAVMQEGKLVETNTVGRESAAGLLDAISGEPSATRGLAQIGGGAMVLPATVYRNRMRDSASLLHLTLLHLRAATRQAETAVACNVAHSADRRLARWLLMTEDRTGAAAFPLTQDYMAVMTGVQRTTVSQLAAALKKAKVIDYSRGHVVVLDRPALERHACECYARMEAQFEALRTDGPEPRRATG
jgi:CRP-like cAMP-binding protein